jgi:TetR/AcrR family transcriptional regulator, transcriptional repressor for nem operon
MARPIEFDLDKAIDKATLLFWRKGYAGTSLRDLLGAMGIGEGSFYNTVKSKKNLYRLALIRYNDTVGKRRLEALQSGSTASAGIRAFFRTVLEDLDDPKTPRVCLVAGSMSGEVLAERELKAYVLRELEGFVSGFAERLQADVDAGRLPPTFQVTPVAQLLVTYLQGMFRMIRVMQTRQDTERQLDAMLGALGL